MSSKFNVGDIVVMNDKVILNRYGRLPIWYNKEHYTIIKFTGEIDMDGYPIVRVDKYIGGRQFNNDISTDFIKPCIKEIRKLKLQKIYASNM